MNIKIFNLISGINETRLLVQHKSGECTCVFNVYMLLVVVFISCHFYYKKSIDQNKSIY